MEAVSGHSGSDQLHVTAMGMQHAPANLQHLTCKTVVAGWGIEPKCKTLTGAVEQLPWELCLVILGQTSCM